MLSIFRIHLCVGKIVTVGGTGHWVDPKPRECPALTYPLLIVTAAAASDPYLRRESGGYSKFDIMTPLTSPATTPPRAAVLSPRPPSPAEGATFFRLSEHRSVT